MTISVNRLPLYEYHKLLSFIHRHNLMDNYLTTLETLSVDYKCNGELMIDSINHFFNGYVISLVDNTNIIIVKINITNTSVDIVDMCNFVSEN